MQICILVIEISCIPVKKTLGIAFGSMIQKQVFINLRYSIYFESIAYL